MLFTPEHIQKIKNRQKTQTRRRISRFKKGPKKGKVVPPKKIDSMQPCKIWMFGKTLCHIKILQLRCEKLGDISREDAYAEGQYTSKGYISGLIEMYDNTIDENEVLWVYEFAYITSDWMEYMKQREKLEV